MNNQETVDALENRKLHGMAAYFYSINTLLSKTILGVDGEVGGRGLTWKYEVTYYQGFSIDPRETSSRSLYHRQLYPKSLASKAMCFASAFTRSTTWEAFRVCPFQGHKPSKALCFQFNSSSVFFSSFACGQNH